MFDTESILAGVSLEQMIEHDTGPGRARRFWCPFCQPGGAERNNAPAVTVKGRYFKCFGCGQNGDAIDYVMLRNGLDFKAACEALGGGEISTAAKVTMTQAVIEQRIKEQAKRAAELDAMLADYSAAEIWAAFNRKMGQEQAAWWEKRGIPRSWQEHLSLGYEPRKTYRGRDGELHVSSAYTIPYFHFGAGERTFTTMQYRLNDPERPADRYRFEKGLPVSYYQVMPDEPIGERAIIAEGAIKAINVAIHAGIDTDISVLATPSKESFAGVPQAVGHCTTVWLIPDPDAWEKPANAPANWMPAPIRLAKEIGKAARIIRLPGKVDDMLNDKIIYPGDFAGLMRTAEAVR